VYVIPRKVSKFLHINPNKNFRRGEKNLMVQVLIDEVTGSEDRPLILPFFLLFKGTVSRDDELSNQLSYVWLKN
jgi:hypothetical protein